MSTRAKLNRFIAIFLAIVIAGMGNLHTTNAHDLAPLNLQSIEENAANWVIWDTLSGENISMLSTNEGWIANFDGKTAYLYHWNGSSWAPSGEAAHPNYTILRGDIQMVSPSDGWLVFYGDYYGPPYYPPESVIYRWDGLSWNLIDTLGGSDGGLAMAQLDVLSSDDVWAVAGTMFGTKFYHWEGVNWTETQYLCCDIAVFRDIEMLSPTDGWSVGYSGITRWDGIAWSQPIRPADAALNSISMVADSDGWVVGRDGGILHLTGNIWTQVTSPVTATLNSIQMVSASDGWAVGDSGVILHWDGSHWSEVSSPTLSDLNEVVMVSADEGWIVGDEVLLRYHTPAPAPTFTSNYASGQPGSYFNLTGANFPADSPVGITINGVAITSTLSTDASGVFTFTLSTQQAEAGRYNVTATVNPSSTTSILLDPLEPLREKEGDWTVIAIPSGIALHNEVFLPFVHK